MNNDLKNREFHKLADTFPSLIPLKGKKPIEEDWTLYCEETRFFNAKEFKSCNAGIPGGPANGIIAIDVDDQVKFEANCKAKGWDLPPTRRHQTGTGKPHIIYKYPQNGKRYGNRALKKYGFDVRGIGGQIVAPGSIHPDTGKAYKVLWDLPIVEAPQWLLELSLQEEEPQNLKLKPKEDINSSETLDIESLPISFSIKNLIKNGAKKGDRSEATGSVLSALIRAKVSDQIIFHIFDHYPIGEKYQEKGRTKTKWLQDEIHRSRNFTNRNNQQQSGGSNLSELKEEFGQDKDIEFIWKDTIPKGQPIMFAGREGSGKTTILLQAAKEIIEMHPYGPVLWVSTEGTVVDTIHKALVLGLEDKGERFQVARKRDKSFKFSLENRSDYNEFDYILNGLPGTLVVFIDSIRGMSRHSENDDILGKVMQSVNALVCDKHKSALVYLDHYKKGVTIDPLDKVAGSTAKTSSVRLVMGVEKKSVTTVHVKPIKNNFMGREIPELESIQVGDKIHIRELMQLTDQSATNKCQLWLTDVMSERKKIPATKLYELGEEKIFSSSLIKKVKKELPITVDRIENRWWWFWALEG